ncbi:MULTISPECIES: hypothetical protein [Clostridium]|jgi:hypothetical protein|uniref:hypothetical protein n=1 Tax=Clostridium TaxID=1485 RepID=UPI00242C5805|nr:hypothetical protein [Clostridium tyrobutyricum]
MENNNTVEIKADVKSKLDKIRNGSVFSSKTTFITELLQNCSRANASIVKIYVENDTYTVIDNGCGLKNPENILTLDSSSWASTKEGFGMGFWSWLCIPDIETCTIQSNKYNIKIDAESLINSDIPKAEYEKTADTFKGFKVTLKSNYIKENQLELINQTKEEAEILDIEIYLNDTEIPHKNIYDKVKGQYIKEFHNKLFDAKLAVTNTSYSAQTYYEKRYVEDIYLWNGHISGILELKKDTVKLKEPDRKQIVSDDKYEMLRDKFNECVKELYKEFVKVSDEETIDKYADTISEILAPEDYEDYLIIDDEEFEEVNSIKQVNSDLSNVYQKSSAFENLITEIKNQNKEQLSLFGDNNDEEEAKKILSLLNATTTDETNTNINKWVKVSNNNADTDINTVNLNKTALTEEVLATINKVIIGNNVFEKTANTDLQNSSLNLSEADYSEEDETVTTSIVATEAKKHKKKTKVVSALKKSRIKVWVKASQIDEYEDTIAKAKYYKIKVFTAKNALYEKLFEYKDIPYISELKDGVEKTNIKKNVGIKTKKEKIALDLISPILKFYNLPQNTVLIGELEILIETKLQGTVVDRELEKNKKDSIKVYGITEQDTGKIILDRRALQLSRFNIKENNYGINEYKFLIHISQILAHELAHLLYHTEDNTVEHYKKEMQIEEEIKRLLETIF